MNEKLLAQYILNLSLLGGWVWAKGLGKGSGLVIWA